MFDQRYIFCICLDMIILYFVCIKEKNNCFCICLSKIIFVLFVMDICIKNYFFHIYCNPEKRNCFPVACLVEEEECIFKTKQTLHERWKYTKQSNDFCKRNYFQIISISEFTV